MDSQNNEDQLFQSSDFGDKLAFTVGFSYIFGFMVGLNRSAAKILQQHFINTKYKIKPLPRKLTMNNMFNEIGKCTSQFASAFAAAGFMYYMTGNALNLLFEDQLDNLSTIQKNMFCGSITGAIFKSTLGVTPSLVGGALGAVIMAGFTLVTEQGNRKGTIAFEMKF